MRNKTVNAEQFSALIGDIYECALEPSKWDNALLRFVNLFSPPDWDVAALMWEGTNVPSIRWVGTTGLVAHAIQIYETVHAGTNVWSSRAGTLPLGRVSDTDELISREAFRASDLYQKFLKTWSMELALFVVFERAGNEHLALTMPGPDGRDLTHLRRGLRLIAPHVQRVIRISHALAESKLRAVGAEAALSLSHVAVFALREDLSVVSSNKRASTVLNEKIIAVKDGRLMFSESTAQQQLLSLASAQTPQSVAFRVENAKGESFAVLAMTIRAERAQVLGGWVEGAKIIVSVSTPHPAPLLEIDRLQAWYDLTATEARLVAALAQGQSLQLFAETRGVTVDAARYLLKGVFRKTGAESQAQLVTMIKDLPVG